MSRIYRYLEWLDHHSFLTALSTLALQYQFLRLSGFFSNSINHPDLLNFYFFSITLFFFSILLIYNIDHHGDQGWANPHSFYPIISLSLFGILVVSALGVGLGWGLDNTFLVFGLGIAVLSSIHLIVFHSRLEKYFFFIKELSVSIITVISILCPLIYLDISFNRGFLKGNQVLILFLIVANSVYFYSWARLVKDQEQGISSLFQLVSFTQTQRFLLTLNFVTLTTLLVSLRTSHFFPRPSFFIESGGEMGYFPAITIVQAYLVKTTHEPNISRHRVLSESLFFILLPFFLW